MAVDRKDILEVLAEAYDDARTGSIGDGGGLAPMSKWTGAESILEHLESFGLEIVRKQDQK